MSWSQKTDIKYGIMDKTDCCMRSSLQEIVTKEGISKEYGTGQLQFPVNWVYIHQYE
jgi:hypothetical protein